jgi:hypothetical protein
VKIDLTQINQDNFIVIENIIAGDRCYLVVPKKSYYGWSRDTLHLRSSIWNEAGEPVSLSFKKFFNWGERDELTYTPFSMTANGGVSVLEKLDGSTLIISKYKGEVIHRTRGTFDARNLPNGFEIGILKSKYPQFFDGSWYTEPTCPFSLIFEWTSPTNQIVIPHAEPEMHLLAIVNHADYTMHSQEAVDLYAKKWNLKRPKRLKFTKIKEMIEAIGAMRDFEGVCVYCNRDQDIRKVKSEWYLKMHHALTEEFSSFERMVEFYFSNGMPQTYQEFFDIVAKYRDFEIATHLRGEISKITDAMKEVRKIHAAYQKFAQELRNQNISRKQMVEKVFATHGNTNRAGMIFALYDGKELDNDSWKKLFFQVIKK